MTCDATVLEVTSGEETETKSATYKERASQIREMIIERASRFGGPFGSNLGAVEIIIALCKVYDFDKKDKIVFDIGQQYQAYKILTGREDRFFDIGKKGGLSRYPDIKESHYDHFSTGHSGTSASAALGYAVNNGNNKAIAFFGDGALTSGEIFEALNHAGELKLNYLAILNQNDWSIDKNIGALADGTTVKQFAESLKFEYRGIYDGHDTELLVEELEKIRHITTPVFLHIKTVKGKGYPHAENDPASFHHAFLPFDKETGQYEAISEEWLKEYLGNLGVYSEKCVEYIEKYPDIFFTAPAYLMGGLRPVAQNFPEHVIDTGINEQHCMTFSSALRLAGSKVIMSLASFFLPRCFDQIFDLCIQRIPLVVVVCFPGIRPSSGPTHQGSFDMSSLRTIPNLTLLHPKSTDEFKEMLDWAVEKGTGPVFIHAATENCTSGETEPFDCGKGHLASKGDDLTVVPIGAMSKAAFYIKENISEKAIEIFNPRTLIPFDYESLLQSIKKTGRLLIIEDGVKSGGIGEGILSFLQERNIACKTRLLSAPDQFVNYGAWGEEEIFKDAGMMNDNILHEARKLLSLK